MKRIIYVIISGLILMGPVSCKKDDPAPSVTLPSTPEALAEHDTKSGGIYKATFATSSQSGHLKIVLQGGKKEIQVTFGGSSRTLTTTGLDSWTSGQDIIGVAFASGDWTMTITIVADGSSFDVNSINLGGVTSVNGALSKETSTALIKVYEGTYSGDDSGKWNFILQNGLINGLYAGGSGSDNFSGSVSGTTIAIATGGTVTASGTMSADGNTTSGNWTGSSTSGTWSGSRTL